MKKFYTLDNVGHAKYTVNYHDGQSRHKDGSNFYGIAVFKSKTARDKFISALTKNGYRYEN